MNRSLAFASCVAFGVVLGCAGSHDGSSDGAARAACLQNLSNLHTSLNAYAQDNDDVLPAANWSDALTPYLPLSQATLRCPSAPAGAFGYAFNQDAVGRSLNSIGDQDTTPLFFDTPNLAANVTSAYPAAPANRHGGNNTVFFSGRLDPSPIDDGSVPPDPAQVRATCLSNLKKMATAAMLYSSDNDDNLPPATWNDVLDPYANGNGAIFHCPSLPSGAYGYAFNSAVVGTNLASAESPATTPMAFDSSIVTRNAVSAYLLANPPRHGGSNVAYEDGHAAQVP